MTLNTTEIGAVIRELTTTLSGGWVQKVYQPMPDILVLEIRVPGQTHRLLCSIRPATTRIHLLRRPLPNPPSPPPFCQLLRARIQGARLDAIEQVPVDRIVHLRLTTRDGPATLTAELFGKRPDLLLIDRESVVVSTLAQDKDRIGRPYAAPAPGLGSSFPEQESELSFLPQTADNPLPISSRLEALYREREAEMANASAVRTRESALRKSLKKELRRVSALQRDLDQASRYECYARYGELLKNSLHLVKKGQGDITVVDYYDDQLPQVTIPLDAAKSPQANMEAYFAKHRKYVSAQRQIVPRLAAVDARIREIERELQAIKDGTWRPPSGELPVGRRGAATGRRRSAEPVSRGPFRRFLSADGYQIFVGRNARENDELTFGLAKSDDVWLHAQGSPGSHVVIRLEKGADPPPETLREAAILSLLYSDLKKSGKGDVIYTRRKWVKKAKGQAAGAVTVTQEKAIHVTLDRTRLDTLKERQTEHRTE